MKGEEKRTNGRDGWILFAVLFSVDKMSERLSVIRAHSIKVKRVWAFGEEEKKRTNNDDDDDGFVWLLRTGKAKSVDLEMAG